MLARGPVGLIRTSLFLMYDYENAAGNSAFVGGPFLPGSGLHGTRLSTLIQPQRRGRALGAGGLSFQSSSAERAPAMSPPIRGARAPRLSAKLCGVSTKRGLELKYRDVEYTVVQGIEFKRALTTAA